MDTSTRGASFPLFDADGTEWSPLSKLLCSEALRGEQLASELLQSVEDGTLPWNASIEEVAEHLRECGAPAEAWSVLRSLLGYCDDEEE